MTVSAVGKNDSSCLSTVAKSTAVGMAVGYSAKYFWPVNKQEIGNSQRKLIKLGQKIANEGKIEELTKLSQRTLAQDAFIKIVESDKNVVPKRAFSMSNLEKTVESLGGKDSVNGKQFRAILKDVNSQAHQIAKRLNAAYGIILKYKRPAIPFLVAGAGTGFIAGIMKNIVKNDV